jgi:peptidoglycan/LPS O-acetylase OafA/YrhL
VWLISIVAIGFGLLTIKSGGDVLFWSEEAREAAGNYVPFVLWSNFISGFLYVIAGVGLLTMREWAPELSMLITIGIIVLFGIFFLYVVNGGAYENRTVVAMSVRTLVWVIITGLAYYNYRKIQSD